VNRTERTARLATTSLVVLVGLAALTACVSRPPEAQVRFVVREDCAGAPRCFATIQAALDAAEGAQAEGWLRVDVAPGHYHEKVTLRRSKTRLHGSGAARTFLRFDAVAETAGHYHRDHWGTAGSATLTIDADNVIVEGITVENTFNYLSNDALAEGDPRKIANSQALALLVDKHSDRVLVQESTLLGYQDTLFADGKRVLVRRSVIAGNVDFIFGAGQLLIVDSTIRTRPRAAAFTPGEVQSIITAPSTPRAQAMGLVVYRSSLTREAGVPDGSVALGRPWHPTRNFPDGRYADPDAVGQASYIDCYMDGHIHREHWTSMPGTARDGTKTHVFMPQDARFFESGSRGPGARHAEIGMRWDAALSVAEIERVLLRDWPEAGAAL
jgi:pectinesterase